MAKDLSDILVIAIDYGTTYTGSWAPVPGCDDPVTKRDVEIQVLLTDTARDFVIEHVPISNALMTGQGNQEMQATKRFPAKFHTLMVSNGETKFNRKVIEWPGRSFFWTKLRKRTGRC